MEVVFETCQDLEIETPEVFVFGVQTSLSLPIFAWTLGNFLSLQFRYDILRESFIGVNDLIKYKQWNLLGYAIHEQFETYIAFPEITEPNRLIAVTRNYEEKLQMHFLPQYPEQHFFIFLYSPSSELYYLMEKEIHTEIIITPLEV